jgi:hypothetical protein
MFGTIEHRFGQADYVALDVKKLDDGRLELFWLHGVESAGEAEKAFGV